MYASTRSSRLTGSTVQAGSMTGSLLRTRNVLCRPAWLSVMTCWLAGRVAAARRGPVSRWWVASRSSTSPSIRTREATSTTR